MDRESPLHILKVMGQAAWILANDVGVHRKNVVEITGKYLPGDVGLWLIHQTKPPLSYACYYLRSALVVNEDLGLFPAGSSR